MSEKKDYQTFRNHVIQPRDRCDRIENLLVAGMPDVNICINTYESWLEIKSPKEPVGAHVGLFVSNHNVSMNQSNWFLRQINAGGSCYLLVATDKRWLLIDGVYAIDNQRINRMTTSELILVSDWHAVSNPRVTPQQWQLLRNALSRRLPRG